MTCQGADRGDSRFTFEFGAAQLRLGGAEAAPEGMKSGFGQGQVGLNAKKGR
jgi:hypothetical protein